MNPQLSKYFRFGKSDLIVFVFFVALAGVGATLLLWGKPQDTCKTNSGKLLPKQNDNAITSKTTNSTPALGSDTRTRDSLILSGAYVGPPQSEGNYTPTRKIPEGITLPLNQVDSATLTQIPGIGPAFARRIINYREQLGGFYTLLQLQEVYGMTTERFLKIRNYLTLGESPRRIALGSIAYDSIPKHPYLNYKQRQAIARILYRDGTLKGWAQLALLPEFSQEDSIRLTPYFSF